MLSFFLLAFVHSFVSMRFVSFTFTSHFDSFVRGFVSFVRQSRGPNPSLRQIINNYPLRRTRGVSTASSVRTVVVVDTSLWESAVALLPE